MYANGQYYAPTQGRFIRQVFDWLDRAVSQFIARQRANTLTWEEFQAKTPQVMQGIVNRSKLAGQSPVMEALGETYIFNAKVWWESPMIQTTVSQGQICITPGTTWQQRFNASREIALNTAMPIAEFGLLAYSPVTMLFPITTADVMMTTSGSDIIRLAQAQQYAEDAAAFARLRAAEAEIAAITARYAGPNGVTIIGENPAVGAEAATWQYEELRVLEDVRYSAATGSSGNRGVIPLGDIRPDLSSMADELGVVYKKYPYSVGDCAQCAREAMPIIENALGENYTVRIARIRDAGDPLITYLQAKDPMNLNSYFTISGPRAARVGGAFHDTVAISGPSGAYYIDAYVSAMAKAQGFNPFQPISWKVYGTYWQWPTTPLLEGPFGP